jgi:glycine/D-amino acid oxidase-like deaminating enzyme
VLHDLGEEVEEVDLAWFSQTLPKLRLRDVGGYVIADSWTLDPRLATDAFAEAAKHVGARILIGILASGVERRQSIVDGIIIDKI